MSNTLDATGLTLATFDELTTKLEADLKSIYGSDIVLDSDTPDGQMIGIIRQLVLDLEDLLMQVYNSFDPDSAFGATLDRRVALNGIQRGGGTNTVTPITVVTDRALTLYGLDQDTNPVYTIQDDAGNQFQLVETQAIGAAGSNIFSFQAVKPGKVLTTLNSITVPVTVVLGVTSVNNPSAASTVGVDEESDIDLRIRRGKSTSIAAQGYHDSLLAALENLSGVTAAFVYENITGSTDADSIPSHSIWVVVTGGDDDDIADTIYNKRNAGCGMKGSVTKNVTQADGTLFEVKWDVVSPENIYIAFSATSINGEDAIDDAAIKTYLVENFKPGVNETIDINHIATLVQAFDPNCLVTAAGLSLTAGSYTNTLSNSSKNKQFTLSSGHISITDL